MAEELKRCPFCGGKASIRRVSGIQNVGGYFVMCEKCLTSGDNYASKRNAADAWNRRVVDE